ncbi:MAG TPA: hypothetical protein VFE62_17165 [Gemmataceae bacterium]|nr:hypothetical protein [Gemmataceae bacterium]
MARRPYDDDHDDDDDRPLPRRSKGKSEGSSSMPLVLLGVIGGALLLCACGGAGVGALVFLGRKDTPQPPIEQPIAKDGPIEKPPIDPAFDKRNPPPWNNGIKDNRDKIKQPPPPADPLKTVKGATTRFLIDGKASMVKDIVFAPQAQGIGVMYWESGVQFKKYFDYWDYKTPKRLARIDLGNEGQGMCLSPKGTRFLLYRNFPAGLSIWSLPDGQQIIKDWNPYARPPGQPFKANAPELTWAWYLDEERMLTLSRNGQFDVWNMAQRQVVASNPAPQKSTFLTASGFSRAPQNFALSPDCRYLALANGDGFDIFEAATARKISLTETFALQGRVGTAWSACFSRDGAMLASYLNLQINGKSEEHLAVWDTATGKKRHQFKIIGRPDLAGPMCWIGQRHLMMFDGNVFKGAIFSLADGKLHRYCQGVNPGDHFARQGPDDRIWYQSGTGINVQAQILAVDLPDNVLIQEPVLNPAQLPDWFFSPNGITRMRPAGGI